MTQPPYNPYRPEGEDPQQQGPSEEQTEVFRRTDGPDSAAGDDASGPYPYPQVPSEGQEHHGVAGSEQFGQEQSGYEQTGYGYGASGEAGSEQAGPQQTGYEQAGYQPQGYVPQGYDPQQGAGQQYQQPPSAPGYQAPYAYPVYVQPERAKGITITAMVLGIISVFFGAVPFFGLAIALAAVIVSGIALSKKVPSRGMSIAGLITGIFGLLMGLFMTFGLIMALTTVDDWDNSRTNVPIPSYESPTKLRGGVVENNN